MTVPSKPAVVVAEAEVRAQLAERHRVEHEVHRVEHPAELGGREHAPLLARDCAVPGQGTDIRTRCGHRVSHLVLPANTKSVLAPLLPSTVTIWV